MFPQHSFISVVESLSPVASSISPFKSIKPNTQFAEGNTASSREWRTDSTRPDMAVISSFSVCNVLLNFATCGKT